MIKIEEHLLDFIEKHTSIYTAYEEIFGCPHKVCPFCNSDLYAISSNTNYSLRQIEPNFDYTNNFIGHTILSSMGHFIESVSIEINCLDCNLFYHKSTLSFSMIKNHMIIENSCSFYKYHPYVICIDYNNKSTKLIHGENIITINYIFNIDITNMDATINKLKIYNLLS
jgi:Zn finger protein HypA/HybF involved in hydrogenase expression